MGVIIFQMKTHSRTDITDQFPDLNNCIVHHCKTAILEIVAGRRKDILYVADCESDDCTKISSESAEKVVEYWNKWNPKSIQ